MERGHGLHCLSVCTNCCFYSFLLLLLLNLMEEFPPKQINNWMRLLLPGIDWIAIWLGGCIDTLGWVGNLFIHPSVLYTWFGNPAEMGAISISNHYDRHQIGKWSHVSVCKLWVFRGIRYQHLIPWTAAEHGRRECDYHSPHKSWNSNLCSKGRGKGEWDTLFITYSTNATAAASFNCVHHLGTDGKRDWKCI